MLQLQKQNGGNPKPRHAQKRELSSYVSRNTTMQYIYNTYSCIPLQRLLDGSATDGGDGAAVLCSSSAFSDQALTIVHTSRHSSLACGWPRSPRFISLPQTRKLADGTEMNTAEPRSLLTASGDAHAKAWVERGRSLHIKRESPKNVNFSRHLFWYGKTCDCAKAWALTPWLRAAPARVGERKRCPV